jgi:hypothetical protein
MDDWDNAGVPVETNLKPKSIDIKAGISGNKGMPTRGQIQ